MVLAAGVQTYLKFVTFPIKTFLKALKVELNTYIYVYANVFHMQSKVCSMHQLSL